MYNPFYGADPGAGARVLWPKSVSECYLLCIAYNVAPHTTVINFDKRDEN